MNHFYLPFSITMKNFTNHSRLLVITVVLFFLSSCSENDTEHVEPAVSQTPSLTIVPTGDDPIIIDATHDDKSTGFDGKKPADRGRYNITLRFLTPITDRQQEVFALAAERWERILINDVPSVTATDTPIPSSFIGFPPVAAVGETIDDIIIEVALAPIDGPGSILGQAGPRFIRTQDNLTLSGLMFFDVADLELLETFNLFEDVIVHEMGHVLGIGTLWSANRSLLAGPVTNPYFTGKFANIHWKAEGGTDFLPVENIGGPGTRLSHWRESILQNELMTGFINLGENPLSRITAGSLRDLGYKTSMVGEKYDLPRNTEGVDPEEFEPENMVDGINIGEMEVILEPVGYVNLD
jgi:hypothetical protein